MEEKKNIIDELSEEDYPNLAKLRKMVESLGGSITVTPEAEERMREEMEEKKNDQ